MLDSERPTCPQFVRDVADLDANVEQGAPPRWPAPWDEPAGLPWWRRLWTHGQGAWIGAAAGALLVVGLLCAGATAHLPLPTGPSTAAWPHIIPIARHATAPVTSHHSATTAAKPIATSIPARVVSSLTVTRPAPVTTPTQAKPTHHGKGHK